jgi:hypothetical protein
MSEPRIFTVIRHFDASGVSGIGRVMDGIIFHTGQVISCWRSDLDQYQLLTRSQRSKVSRLERSW